ncbi:hypothetical protein HDU67_008185 [Dinochytrium kinnereticum]|nr:hypothetical protein HDU67_008185 [Dinochytrium kinnereticum]
MSLFSDSNCTSTSLITQDPRWENSTYDCILMSTPTFVFNLTGLGVFGDRCDFNEIRINGCTNVTGKWLNRRRGPSSGAAKLSFPMLLIALLAWCGLVQARRFEYDVQMDTSKMPFCLRNINADQNDYVPSDFIGTLESMCQDRGSTCAGKSTGIKAWWTESGDRLSVDYADNRGARPFVYNGGDDGWCSSAGNLKISAHAGWVRSNPHCCSVAGGVAEVGVKASKMEGIFSRASSGALAAVDFFNAILKLMCGLREGLHSISQP